MPSRTAILNDIAARHQAIGLLCYEAEVSYKAENYMAALACLFIIAEASLKHRLDIDSEDKRGLYEVIEKAQSEGNIGDRQYETLHIIRGLRNNFFHKNHYEYAVEIDGLIAPFYEAHTRKRLYEVYSLFVFKLAHQMTH